MDVTVIRWVSLGVVLSLAALAAWALADATREDESDVQDKTADRSLMLEVRRPGRPPELVRVEDGVLLGRGRECHIVFDDATVSKEHARLRVEGRAAFIEDLHSTNGTLVNGKAIDGPTQLRRGDRIGLGPNVMVFAGEV
jgi:pSer/pThr/pTyr-binding forkhead associated (FHA) protein